MLANHEGTCAVVANHEKKHNPIDKPMATLKTYTACPGACRGRRSTHECTPIRRWHRAVVANHRMPTQVFVEDDGARGTHGVGQLLRHQRPTASAAPSITRPYHFHFSAQPEPFWGTSLTQKNVLRGAEKWTSVRATPLPAALEVVVVVVDMHGAAGAAAGTVQV